MAKSTRRVTLVEGVQELSDGSFDNVIFQLVAGRAANIIMAGASGDIEAGDIGHILSRSVPTASFDAVISSGQSIFANTSPAMVGAIIAITEY